MSEAMKADGIEPDTTVYNALISACAQGQQWALAELFYEEMQASGIPADEVTLAALVTAYGRSGEAARAVAMLDAMPSVVPNLIAYNAAISACQITAQWQLALTVWEKLQDAQLQADAFTYNSLISVFEKANLMDVAKAWFEVCPMIWCAMVMIPASTPPSSSISRSTSPFLGCTVIALIRNALMQNHWEH